jgi:hypothetical protein
MLAKLSASYPLLPWFSIKYHYADISDIQYLRSASHFCLCFTSGILFYFSITGSSTLLQLGNCAAITQYNIALPHNRWIEQPNYRGTFDIPLD